jgi:L-asparaginase
LGSAALLKVCLDDTGALLRAVPDLGYAGLVLEALGAGHVPQDLVDSIETIASQMPVVLATRVAPGPVCSRTYGYPGSEMDLIRRGAVPAGLLSSVKARILLMLALAQGADRGTIAALFRAHAPPYFD